MCKLVASTWTLALASLLLVACSAPPVKEAAYVPRGLDAPRPVKDTDYFAEFRGDHQPTGKVFRLQGKPVAIDGPNVIVTLVKSDWSTMTTPGGKEHREATAQVMVQRGAESHTVSINQGDDAVAFNVRISVKAAGEDYNKLRLDYLPWVDCQIDAL